jgi:phage gpG-like protein
MAVTPSYRAVVGKLGTRGGLTSSMGIVDMHFEPSIGITARRVDKLGLDIRSFRDPLRRAIKEVMAPSFQANFDAGGRPSWAPQSEATQEIRGRLGGGGGLMIKSGSLRRVMGQINIWTISKDVAMIKDLPARVWYGKVHQAGYEGSSMRGRLRKHGGDAKAALDSLLDDQYKAMKAGKRVSVAGAASIPARPFVMFQPEDEDDIAEIFIKWLDERLVKSGLGV